MFDLQKFNEVIIIVVVYIDDNKLVIIAVPKAIRINLSKKIKTSTA